MYPSNPTALNHSLLRETVKKKSNSKTSQLVNTKQDVSKRKSHESETSKILIGDFCSFFKLVETTYPNSAFQIYMVALSIIILIVFKVRSMFLQDIDGLEVLGIGLILAFLLNLVLIKDLKQKIFRKKKANFCFVRDILIFTSGSWLFLFHGLQILPSSISMSIYFSALVLVILLETMIYEKEFSVSHLLLTICAYVGVILVLFDSNNSGNTITNYSLLYGIGIVGISGIFLAVFFIKFSQVTESRFLSLNCSFALLSVLKITLLDEDGWKWPTFIQAFFLGILGALIFFCFVLLARSFQLTESAGEISPYLFLPASISPLLGWLFTNDESSLRAIGSLFTQASLLLLWLENSKSPKTREIRQLDSVIAIEIEMTEKSLNTTYD